MGKLIFCTGEVTENPYIFPFTKTKIYSMDELNYYIYNNIYLISEDTFQYSLCDWIERDLLLPEVADKIRNLLNRRNSLKDIVVSLLCSADYYTEQQIRELIQIMEQIERMPLIKKQKIKADNYLMYGQYAKALAEYEAIVDTPEAAAFTQVEYGDIYHNIAVAKAKTISVSEAAKYYLLAYRRNQREESLVQYLYALLLSKNTEEYKAACEEFAISKERQEQLEEDIFTKELAALEIEDYVSVDGLSDLKKDGKVEQYYKELKNTIRQYKDTYRKGILS
jgi:tetratricopeptide (TPR) repeat protein